MVKHNTLPMVYDNSRSARIGLLRRDAADAAEVQWFEVGLFCALSRFHTSFVKPSSLRLLVCLPHSDRMAVHSSAVFMLCQQGAHH